MRASHGVCQPESSLDGNGRVGEQGSGADLDRFSTLRRMATDPRRRFVVSMGGGGVPALSGNLVLAELLEALGLRDSIAEIWGTSAGAVIGGSWASGTRAPRMREILFSLPKNLADIDWLSLAKGVLLRPFGAVMPDAILHGKRFYEAMVSALEVDTFEQCEIPFRCIACADDPSGRRLVFRQGALAPAISASMSLPGILLPRDEQGQVCHEFLDGGLVEKTPLYSPLADHKRLNDGRELLILGTHFGPRTNRTAIAHGFVERLLATIDALEDHLWEHQEEEARRQPGTCMLLLDARIDQNSVFFDFQSIGRNCELDRAVFEDQLQNAKIALTLGTSCGPRPPCPV